MAAEEFSLLAESISRGRFDLADGFVDRLLGQWPATSDGGAVAEAASMALQAALAAVFEKGWQPADLVHAVGRKLTAVDRRLLVGVVVAGASPWRTHPHLDPDWAQQLDELEGDIGGPAGDRSAVAAWVADERLVAGDALWRAAQLLAQLWATPGIAPVGDPPSRWGSARRTEFVRKPTPAGIDERILTRVRALLAKAESTEFEPEAEALTAKAQELMGRYAIDQALVTGEAAAGATGDQPISRRVLIHDPYAKGKATLLSNVGRANRCQTVWSKDLGHCTVFGFPTDLAVTDILYTSLVAQSSRAMLNASRSVRNPRSFRESFGVSFAVHIGDRLREATDKTVAEATADHGPSLLPVLAHRDEAVEEARQAAFPKLRSASVRSVDARGWAAGQAAAELADLGAGKRLAR